MKKSDVLELFGGLSRTSTFLRVSLPLIGRWEEDLNLAQQDRVIAACWRNDIDPFPLVKDNDDMDYRYIRKIRELSHANT